MKVIRAESMGICFGVRDAIALAEASAARGPVTILGDLVHNPTVMQDLRAKGVRVVAEIAEVTTATVMVTAHGVSNRRLGQLEATGKTVVQATCPLVAHAHRTILRLAREGYHPVVIGKKGHVEVRGLTEDLEAYDLVETAEEVEAIAFRPRFGVASQTTQPLERVRDLVQRLRKRHPQAEVRWLDTVCQPTRQRQRAAQALAKQCEVVIVVGGPQSNNSRELAATCRRFCPKVFQVSRAADLEKSWFDGARLVGLTAGTSTPENVIAAVESQIQTWVQRKTPSQTLSHV